MTDQSAIDWPARLERALAHLERRTAEQREAAEKRRAPKWIVYDYRDEPTKGNDDEMAS